MIAVVVAIVVAVVLAVVVVVAFTASLRMPVMRPKGNTSPVVITGETMRRTALVPFGISHDKFVE